MYKVCNSKTYTYIVFLKDILNNFNAHVNTHDSYKLTTFLNNYSNKEKKYVQCNTLSASLDVHVYMYVCLHQLSHW